MARMPASGTERQLVGKVLAAREHGLWNPTVAVLFDGFALTQDLRDAGIDVVELGSQPAWHPRRAVRLRQVLKQEGFDVLHTSLWGASLFGRAVAALGRQRPALVMSERRVEDFRHPLQRTADRLLASVTEAYIGNSTAVADFVARAHRVSPRRVVVIANGIDEKVFRPGSPPPPGPVLELGAVGRLVHQKGFDVLIEALPKVLTDRQARLTIVGEGPLQAELTTAAGDLPVRFRGFLSEPSQVAEFLCGLAVFVMPSRYEGLPNALLEAQACGIPAVASDAPGIAEASGPGVTLVAPEDPARLAEGIIAQADTGRVSPPPGLRTFETVATEHLAVFERAVDRRRRRS